MDEKQFRAMVFYNFETLLEEARQEEREKLATFIRENRNTVTLVQIEDFISSLIHYGNIGL